MSIGGSVESMEFDGRGFPVSADSDVKVKIGGFENESVANGDGTGRQKKMRILPSVSGAAIGIDDARGDQEFLQGLADSNGYFPFSVTYASGTTYQGSMQLEGGIEFSTQSTTIDVELVGTGKLTKQ